ncbi:APC family permease [Streptacidiphilus fuscans]|uniref:APC family permease n=1 Tax=Streptacidiphilus fuscans TaxID=2789292 RepID=A0A931BGQ6_9ACTN|nr:APC family permease [Streptacidiphilus fuscans]MBF9073853.1 APC family permease [Streptacidiphilus fuscans]
MTDILRRPSDGTAESTPHIEAAEPQKLKRSIGVVGGTLLTLSCLTPASSLFVIVPASLAVMGTGTALALIIAIVLCIGVAWCYSELGTLVPSAGGEYAMAGHTVGRFTGWLAFIQALLVVLIVPPVIALGTAQYLSPIVHIDPKVMGAIVMLAATVMGLLDLRANAWITGIFLVLEVVAASLVAILGFAHSNRSASVLFHPELPGAHGGVSIVTMGTIIAGLAGALFITQGFSTAVYLAEEMERPHRTVPRTVLWTLGIGSAVILIPVIAITLGAPSLDALAGGDISSMVTQWSNSAVGTFVSLAIAMAIINAAIVMVIQNSRVLYSSARDKAWPEPINRAFTSLSKRYGSPWISTLAVGVPGAILCFVNLDTLSAVTGVSVALLYLCVAVASLGARRGPHKAAKAYRMPLWPVVPIILIVVLLYVVKVQPLSALCWTGGITAAAALYWVFYLRPRPDTRWIITVPEDEKEASELVD